MGKCMEKVRQLVSAILAGIMIGMGGTIFLSVENSVLGSFLFAVGLFTVVGFQLHLYTGRIGYLPLKNLDYIWELAVTWIGNLIGTFLMAKAVQQTRIFQNLKNFEKIAAMKLSDGNISLFFLGIFCGILMFIAVDTYQNNTGSTVKMAAIFLPVMVFILSGFEHVIANMFYFSIANAWSVRAVTVTAIVTVGNSIGAMLIPMYFKFFKIR